MTLAGMVRKTPLSLIALHLSRCIRILSLDTCRAHTLETTNKKSQRPEELECPKAHGKILIYINWQLASY
jgi:hypothetical protein